MESFQWGQHFETGFLEVDNQHHHLVNIINRFGRLLSVNEIDIKDVERLFGQLADYAIYHFKEEERLMIESNLDPRHVKSHIEVHKGFLEDLTSIYSTITPSTISHANFLLKFLTHWLAYHILGKDQDMARQIESINSGVKPSDAYELLEKERLGATAPLLAALSGLFEQVSQRNKELKELNDSLEQKVLLRTQELSKLNKHLEELSLTDSLTGLPNRRHAMRRLTSCWDEATQTKTPIVCMMIDVDHFKQVNDIYGHDIGDSVLKEIATALTNAFRNDDVVCRLGGDEFFIICPNTTLEGATYIAERARQAVSKLRVFTGGEPWYGRISIGIASKTPNCNHYEDIIKSADSALYEAKDEGKNCIKVALNN